MQSAAAIGGSMSSGMAGRMLAPRTAGIYVRWGTYWLWIWRQPKCLLQDQSRKAAASFVRTLLLDHRPPN